MGPGGMFGAVVGGILDDGVRLETIIIQEVEHQADVVIVLQHAGTMVVGLRSILLCGVSPLVVQTGIKVHAARVEPDEKGLTLLLRLLHEIKGLWNDLSFIEVFHPLLSERPGVFDLLLAHLAEAWVRGRIIGEGFDFNRFGGLTGIHEDLEDYYHQF